MEEQISPAVLIIPALVGLGLYLYFALCFFMMAKKTNTPNGWLAFVPIANIFQVLQLANKPAWWFLLFFVPLVNIAISIVVFMEIAKRLNKPEWVGVLMIVPGVNFFVPAYLAFSK